MSPDEPLVVLEEREYAASNRLRVLLTALLVSCAWAAWLSIERVDHGVQVARLEHRIGERCDPPAPGEIVVGSRPKAANRPICERLVVEPMRPIKKGKTG